MLPFLMETMATNMTTTSPGQNKALVLQAFDTLAASHAAPYFASASNLRASADKSLHAGYGCAHTESRTRSQVFFSQQRAGFRRLAWPLLRRARGIQGGRNHRLSGLSLTLNRRARKGAKRRARRHKKREMAGTLRFARPTH
jgi:hypothetical protein